MKNDDRQYAKDAILKRINEIIRDYLYDKDESYAYISLYFEKSNGENQEKVIRFGEPSQETPDFYRDQPAWFTSDKFAFNMLEVPFKRITWETLDGREWTPDGIKDAE